MWRFKKKPSEPSPEALAAQERAARDLHRVLSLWPEVQHVVGSFERLQERNHFAEQIRLIFEGGRHR